MQNSTTFVTKSVRTQKSKNLSLKRIRIINLNIFNNGIPSFKSEGGIPFHQISQKVNESAVQTENKVNIINSTSKDFLKLPLVKDFFEKLGLPCDKSSLHLVQFFQQLEIKPDLPKLIKSYNLAKKFPKKEGKAAEIAYLLEEKNISADEEKIQNVLSLLEHNNDKNDSEKNSKDSDFLKLMNHKAGKNKYWLIFPYELTLEKEKADGIIRLLCDREKKNTEKIIISANFSRIFYNFVIYCKYSGDGYKSLTIDFCTKPELTLLKKRNSISILQELFAQHPDTIITYSRYNDERSDFFSADSEFSIITEN